MSRATGSLGGHQLIGSYVHLPSKPREQHALYLLRKVASLVKPIMLQHGLTVGTLAEFYPEQHNLLGLNVNGGEKIFLRLRRHFDEGTFLDEEEVVFIMLHELAHNVHGPHDERFNRLLSSLEGDYYALRRKGYSGEGFYSNGQRLGVGHSHNANMSEARRRALQAAEAQNRKNTLSRGSGQKLGSGGPMPMPHPIQQRGLRERLAAAVEKRIRDSRSCGGGSTRNRGEIEAEAVRQTEQAIRNGFKTKAEEDDANERAILKAAVELIEEAEKREKEQEQQNGTWQEREGYIWFDEDEPSSTPTFAEPSSVAAKRPAEVLNTPPMELGVTWACSRCTLHNPEQYLQCEACGAERPVFSSPDTPHAPPRSNNSTAGKSTQNPVVKKLGGTSQDNLAKIPLKPPPPAWYCHMCTLQNDALWWTCQGCGTMKLSS